MEAFREYVVATAHVVPKHAPYYVGWVQQAYALASSVRRTMNSDHRMLMVDLRTKALSSAATRPSAR